MKRFVEGVERSQSTLFPDQLEDWIDEDNQVRVIDTFVDALDLFGLGFARVVPRSIGRPSYHPSVLLKLYVYGYLNRVQSSRRLEREASRNVEVMWLLGRLVPNHKTIANFRKDNGRGIRKCCVQFVSLCRQFGLLADASVAIDGGKFKAVNTRDKNSPRARCNGVRRRSRRASRVICTSWKVPIDRIHPWPARRRSIIRRIRSPTDGTHRSARCIHRRALRRHRGRHEASGGDLCRWRRAAASSSGSVSIPFGP